MARSISNRRPAHASRVILISRRSGASAGTDAASFVGYVASVPGGKADFRLGIVNGVVQTAVPKTGRDWEFFDYALGAFGLGNGGFGWSGGVCWPAVFVNRVASEGLDAYAPGAVTVMSGGTGWSCSAAWGAPNTIRVGEERFETYPAGTVTGSDLSGGTGWAGAPLVVAH